MENLVTRLSYHIAVAALQRQNELHLFAMCLAINIYVVIQGSKKKMTKWTKLYHCWCFQPRFLQKKKKIPAWICPSLRREIVWHPSITCMPRITGEDESVAMALACPEIMFCHDLIRRFTNCSSAFPVKATKSRERRSQVLLTLVSHVIKKETKMVQICLKQKKYGKKHIFL